MPFRRSNEHSFDPLLLFFSLATGRMRTRPTRCWFFSLATGRVETGRLRDAAKRDAGCLDSRYAMSTDDSASRVSKIDIIANVGRPIISAEEVAPGRAGRADIR